MSKKIIAISASVLILMGCTTSALAATYEDTLMISFNGFAPGTLLYETYQGSKKAPDAAAIFGPEFTNTDNNALVVVKSAVLDATGNPSMTIAFSPTAKSMS